MSGAGEKRAAGNDAPRRGAADRGEHEGATNLYP
jgi:hypothetical protein